MWAFNWYQILMTLNDHNATLYANTKNI